MTGHGFPLNKKCGGCQAHVGLADSIGYLAENCYAKAYAWLDLARGTLERNGGWVNLNAGLENKMSPEQIAKAQKCSDELRARIERVSPEEIAAHLKSARK